jgi:hypothetical protein
MRRRTRQALPAGLERARQRFERWRRTRGKGRPRIPESLWAVAAKAARGFGVHQTSRALRLDYVVLKRHVVAEEVVPPDFVELIPAGSGNGAECVLELEEPSGTRIRIELKGIASPDVIALTRGLRAGGA